VGTGAHSPKIRDGQENLFWNSTLRQREPTLREDLLKHLSPLGWEHISLTGDYVWNPGGGPKRGQFRPLRTIPSTVTP
jgi:Tn3 transposase DDE domain